MLQLRKGQPVVEQEPLRRGGFFELLGDQFEVLTPLQSNELGKVCEAADESVDFAYHQDVDLPGLDVFE